MDVRRLAICDPSNASREPLRNLLLGMEGVSLEAESNRYEFFRDVVEQLQPDIAIIALDSDPNRGLQLIQQLVREMPQVAILAVSARTDGPFILQTLRTGAKEFIPQPIQFEELLSAIDRAHGAAHPGEYGAPAGGGAKSTGMATSKVIAIVGSRGGIGSTSVAVNLGVALALDKENKVVLVDLDLALGDSDVTLDIIPSYTLADVAMNIAEIDQKFLRGALSRHETGLFLLPHPVQLDDVGMIHEEHLQRLVSLLRAGHTHILLDLSKSFRPTDFAAMQLADVILLMGQLELTSIRNCVRLVSSMNSVDGLNEKLRIVMNRVGSDDQDISVSRAEESIQRRVFWQVPNDSKAMIGSRNAGKPLALFAPKSKAWQSLQQLALVLSGKADAPAAGEVKKQKKGGWFGRS
ncbi:MAG TPA: AAA family ATPase [Gemmatales bacterium]|nr:AAA family ATPase [Gemmatales bacterium]HMP60123.1 AAA family ATPase [Gemmatales bacterium]